jgi:uncharacterized membrane protein YadS
VLVKLSRVVLLVVVVIVLNSRVKSSSSDITIGRVMLNDEA